MTPCVPRRAAIGAALGALAIATSVWLGTRSRASAVQTEPPEMVTASGIRFVRIPQGKFVMGSPQSEAERHGDELPHEVVLSRAFWMSVHEITQSQYEKVMGTNPSYFVPGKPKVRASSTRDHPVENVTWHDAVAFCKKLSEQPEAKAAQRRFRLPTEAEWEYACRAGTRTALHYGDAVDSDSANFNGLSPYGAGRGGPFWRCTMEVGKYGPNKFGLRDMHGNVMEWCHDWYAADYYKSSPKQDPRGPETGTERVMRGGSWTNSGMALRSAARAKLAPDQKHYGLGFRIVFDAPVE